MRKPNEQKDLSSIAVALSVGKFNGEDRKKVIIPFIILVIICVFGMVLAITMLSIEFINFRDSLAEFIGTIILVLFGFSLVPIVCIILICRNEKIRKKILLWVKDSVELKAYCKNLDITYWMGVPLIKFQVEFNIDGVNYVRTSENERQGLLDLGRPVGYFSGVSKYVDKEIQILYSQKYDQVMILKD